MWCNGIFSVRGSIDALRAFRHRSRSFSAEIFVSRLSSYTTEEDFRSTFSPFGNIEEVRLIRDKLTHRPKGYGFVRYESKEEAQRAMKAMDGRIVEGRLIFVEIAKSEEGNTP
ncbi:unnamed protein product [Spirodela intermedia]|uniref:RRM domain-containing protein n=1 Tax=Spirodela intermedia TaxID=51605 RepID=A0A7I8KK21_SPIIN|nr:unnamed protein product [Spirodela intermedia]